MIIKWDKSTKSRKILVGLFDCSGDGLDNFLHYNLMDFILILIVDFGDLSDYFPDL